MKGYATTSEGQIHYRTEGSGRPLLLLHQAPSSSSMWEAMMEPLAMRGYRAIAFDLPGYGASDPPPIEPDLAYYSRRIADAAQQLEANKYDVVGHHTGASVAIQMALDFPDRVGKIVAYGIALLDPAFALQLASEEPPSYNEQADEVVEWWRSRVRFGGTIQERVLVRSIAEMLESGSGRAYGHGAVGKADHAVMLKALTHRVLAVAGRRERLYTQTRIAAERFENIRFHELGDAAMDAADELSDEFAELIDRFLQNEE